MLQHPKNKSVVSGAEVRFSVKATGDGLNFQWQKDCKDLDDGGKYRKTTTDTLHIVQVTKDDDKARYRCRVKNYHGKEKLSEEATLFISKLLIVRNGC